MCGSRSGLVSQPRASSFFLEGLRVNGERLWWWLRVRRSDCTDQRQRASERGE